MTTMTDTRSKQRMDLMKLIDEFGSEELCRDYLKHLRWPNGPECVKCGSVSLSWISTRRQFDCNSCRARFSVTAGTVFHDSHLPLRKWFLAAYMMCESKKGISANQLKRTLAVSYKTAWYLCHRIRSAMDEAVIEQLEGVVEIDETYIGGKSTGRGRDKGKKFEDKTMVLGAIERGGNIRLRVEQRKRANNEILTKWIAESVSPEADGIYTDKHPGYRAFKDERHASVDHSADEWIRGDVSTQSIESAWSLLKRSIVGSYHQLSEKHLQAYMDEFAFRFNNRENPYLFRDTLLRLVDADALTYSELTAERP